VYSLWQLLTFIYLSYLQQRVLISSQLEYIFVLKTKESVAQVVKEYPAFYTDLSLQRAQ